MILRISIILVYLVLSLKSSFAEDIPIIVKAQSIINQT